MTTKHRIALIGLGMGSTPHAQSLIDLRARVEVAAAYTRSPERAAAFANRFSFPLSHDLEGIAADASINCVLIATPPSSHLELVERFAAAGKHILLEKPLDVSVARAEALVAACDRHGVRLGVVFQHRFRPAALRLRELVLADAFGAIAVANVYVPWWRPQSYYDLPGRGTLARDGGGVLITQAIHTLDLFLSLIDGVAEVMAYGGTTPLHRMETEDTVAAALRLRGGAFGALSATTANYPGFGESIELIGAKGTARLTGAELNVHFQDGRTESAGELASTGGGADPMAFSHEAHRAVLAEFLDAIEQDRDPVNSGRAGLKVHYLIAALLDSMRLNAPVKVAAGP
jgi:predicted dehydrogenase